MEFFFLARISEVEGGRFLVPLLAPRRLLCVMWTAMGAIFANRAALPLKNVDKDAPPFLSFLSCLLVNTKAPIFRLFRPQNVSRSTWDRPVSRPETAAGSFTASSTVSRCVSRVQSCVCAFFVCLLFFLNGTDIPLEVNLSRCVAPSIRSRCSFARSLVC